MWRQWWFWLIIVVVLGFGTFAIVKVANRQKHLSTNTPVGSLATTTDAVSVGKQLSDDHCTGTGTVPLTSGPMKPVDIAVIEPYGLTVGGHVTPVDHQYYYAKNNVKDSSDVLALADGHLVNFEFRPHSAQDQARNGVAGDYRVIISYSCTFLSYFDLATSLAPDIEAQLPKGWEQNGHGGNGQAGGNIAVKAGQAIAKMGGQSLDFAIWDTTKTNPKLLVPAAYTAENWKIHTVAPLDYFSDSVKTSLLPFYVRHAEPRDGTYAYDQAGKVVGTWFLKGSGGYGGNAGHPGQAGYWSGHLAIAPDWIDPSVLGFSIGDYQGQATQFEIKSPFTDPTTIGIGAGLVKFELLHAQPYKQADGQTWMGTTTPTSALTLPVDGSSQATAILQLTDASTLKVELFPGKTPDQVTAFDSAAKLYTRSGE